MYVTFTKDSVLTLFSCCIAAKAETLLTLMVLVASRYVVLYLHDDQKIGRDITQIDGCLTWLSRRSYHAMQIYGAKVRDRAPNACRVLNRICLIHLLASLSVRRREL